MAEPTDFARKVDFWATTHQSALRRNSVSKPLALNGLQGDRKREASPATHWDHSFQNAIADSGWSLIPHPSALPSTSLVRPPGGLTRSLGMISHRNACSDAPLQNILSCSTRGRRLNCETLLFPNRFFLSTCHGINTVLTTTHRQCLAMQKSCHTCVDNAGLHHHWKQNVSIQKRHRRQIIYMGKSSKKTFFDRAASTS